MLYWSALGFPPRFYLATFALAIYGLITFSQVLGHIEVSVIDFFSQFQHGSNPTIEILAKTIRSLNHCLKTKKNILREVHRCCTCGLEAMFPAKELCSKSHTSLGLPQSMSFARTDGQNQRSKNGGFGSFKDWIASG